MRRLFVSGSAAARIDVAAEAIAREGPAAEVVVLASGVDAAAEVARAAAGGLASFGWYRLTLGQLANALGGAALAEERRAPAGALALEALAARVVHALREGAPGDAARPGGLGRFEAIADRPGLPRALARTLGELRLAGVSPEALADPDLARVLATYDAELARAELADRARLLEVATRAATHGAHDLLGKPLVLLDLELHTTLERQLVRAVAARAPRVLATCPWGDDRSSAELARALDVAPEIHASGAAGSLGRLQRGLFAASLEGEGAEDATVELLSAPGESRECVEVARAILREAERGTPFDRVGVLVRTPGQYRAHLEEAFRRAGVPAHFARGTRLPDPTGRALLALLACAAEDLSASRFAEYLSLGEVPDATDAGAPPPAAAREGRWVPPDDELAPRGARDVDVRFANGDVDGGEVDGERDGQVDGEDDGRQVDGNEAEGRDAEPGRGADPETSPVVAGTLRAPRHWERLLVDAAVIGGRARWKRRLDGLRETLRLNRDALDDPGDEASVRRIERDLAALEALAGFALPLLDDLATLPRAAPWSVWLDRLTALATRALRRPARVLSVLAELAPMGSVGPVELGEVRVVLDRRLGELVAAPVDRRYGRVYVAAAEEARGLAFDVVFVLGLAEKVFPQKVAEDPLLPDVARAALGPGLLRVTADRTAAERLALRLAAGAARRRIVLSWPRLDLEQSRPRTPSFYALEVVRAATGKLPDARELEKRAQHATAPRLGWPAPARPDDAIDDAEHDLALLAELLHLPIAEAEGRARFLLSANAHLARALRARAERWSTRWYPSDGLVDPSPEGRAALASHQLGARSYSPTALQHYAACPYRFVLSALHRLAPREEPEPIDELNPLQKGSLVHDALYTLFRRLRDEGLLPLRPASLEPAMAHLERVVDEVAARFEDDLAPAIERVWQDGLSQVRADLRELVRRAAASEEPWTPELMELSFGLRERRANDEKSTPTPAALDAGLALRGSIDLVERGPGGKLRATDYKTGKKRANQGQIIGGGKILQPVLYALALEKILPGESVEGGRLYYCTADGGFAEVTMPLDADARAAAGVVTAALGGALEQGFLPAAPDTGECTYCDFVAVCGPYEEQRLKRKRGKDRLAPLVMLRRQP